VVSSGHTAQSALSIHNMTTDRFTVLTHGYLTAIIVDPLTGRAVGRVAGAQRYVTACVSDPETGLVRPASAESLPIVRFELAPGGTSVVPVLVGTASVNPDVGYAVPAGEWAVQVILEFADGRYLRTAQLPVTVTSQPR
jgi:hypothetical protein